MKKTWKLIMACMAIACASLVMGCSDDDATDNGDDTEINNPVEPNPEEPDGSLQEPEKAKEKLNTVGKDLVALVNADDFKDLATVAEALSSLLEEEDYDYGNETPDYGPYAQNILAAARGNMGSLYTMTRATHQASEYYGTYEYTNGEWVWTENPSSGKFIARFPVEGQNAELTAACSGGETDFTYDGETFKIPAKVEANITWKNNTLAKVEVTTANLKTTSPYEAEVNATVTVGSKYIITSYVKANATTVNANSKVTIDGKEAVVGKAVVGGQNITEDSEKGFEERVNTAEGQVILLDDAYITLKCDDVKGFSAILDEEDESSEIFRPVTKDEQIAKVKKHNQEEMDEAAQTATDYAKYLKGDLRFKSQTEASATLGFQSYKDYSYEAYWEEYRTDANGNFIPNEWGGYDFIASHPLGIDWEYWDVETIVVFSDGSKMSFDEFDGNSSPLKGFIDSLEDLIDSFGKLLD